MGLIGLVAELVVLSCIAGGIACNVAVVSTCEMLELAKGQGSIGPWRADLGDGCQSWGKDDSGEDDWLINMARACSMMALIFGCVLGFFGFFNQCLCPLPCSQRILDLSSVGVQIGLALTWPMIRSDICDLDGGCSWGSGSTALILAQLLYLAAGIFTRCMREPRYMRRQDGPGDEK